MSMVKDDKLILLTGASGYVGGRLLNEFERIGYRVRCLSRRPEYLKNRVLKSTEVVKGDVFDKDSLRASLEGVHTAYYFIHSLAKKGSFVENDRIAASNFAVAARKKNVQRIIYLGGLGEKGKGLSDHLSSRQDVGEILRNSGVTTIEFRSSIIIGSGSLSFEMARSLVEKLPIMITPRWVRTLTQPIAIEDVIEYLIAVIDVEISESTVLEIGGADKVSYEGIMKEYARIRGLKRLIIPVPVLTPWLSGLWLVIVTPLYYVVGRWLIEGVQNETTVKDNKALKVFNIRPRGIQEAIERALKNEDREFSETRWSDALQPSSTEQRWGGVRFGSRLVASYEIKVPYPPPDAFRPIKSIGGTSGWYKYNWLWYLRGFLDQILGGVGTRRGRRNPKSLLLGDTVDFWRVEAIEQNRLLRLNAEMKLPGRGWLQFEVERDKTGSIIRQTLIFDPIGIPGLLYWYPLYPIHKLILKGTLNGIAKSIREQ